MKDRRLAVGFVICAGALSVCLHSRLASAQMVSVDATATGRFGQANLVEQPPGAEMIAGFEFTKASSIAISATGLIDLTDLDPPLPNAVLDVPPSGYDGISRTGVGLESTDYLPLEEALVEEFGPAALSSDMADVGALLGAFVRQEVVDQNGFMALDREVSGNGIAPNSLFLVGSSLANFTAPGPGTLFLGVNDAYGPNNLGAFDVTFDPIPNDIDGTAAIGSGTTVGEGSVLKRDVQVLQDGDIGDDVTLNRGVGAGDDFEVGDGTVINRDTNIGNDVTIGQDVTIGRLCEIENSVDIGDGTTIGQKCMIGNDVMIGSNVFIGRDVTIADYQIILDDSVIPAFTNIP
jgi:acetyltransferase-like isoleucine patch superfamily enzyme